MSKKIHTFLLKDGCDFHIPYSDDSDLKDPQTPISSNKTISILFNYPLSGDYIFKLNKKNGSEHITKADFVNFVQAAYHEIYDDEETYGVWGHDLRDLFLEGAEQRKDGVFKLHVGS